MSSSHISNLIFFADLDALFRYYRLSWNFEKVPFRSFDIPSHRKRIIVAEDSIHKSYYKPLADQLIEGAILMIRHSKPESKECNEIRKFLVQAGCSESEIHFEKCSHPTPESYGQLPALEKATSDNQKLLEIFKKVCAFKNFTYDSEIDPNQLIRLNDFLIFNEIESIEHVKEYLKDRKLSIIWNLFSEEDGQDNIESLKSWVLRRLDIQ